MIDPMSGTPSLAQLILDQLKEFKEESRYSSRQLKEELKEYILDVKGDVHDLKVDVQNVKLDVKDVKFELTKDDGVLDRLAALEARDNTPVSISVSPPSHRKTTKEQVVNATSMAGAGGGAIGIVYALTELVKSYLASTGK
jgi:hypothetical protein